MPVIDNDERDFSQACTMTLARARRRFQGHELPVTPDDTYQTEQMIDITTRYLEGDTRLDVLANYLAIWLVESQSRESQEQVVDVIMHCLREGVDWAIEEGTYRHGREKIKAEMEMDGDVRGTISPGDFALADKALSRAIRRYSGESLIVTEEDLLGTVALITQLMADIEIALVVDKLADATVEEYKGQPPKAVFVNIRSIIQQYMRHSDLSNSGFGAPLH